MPGKEQAPDGVGRWMKADEASMAERSRTEIGGNVRAAWEAVRAEAMGCNSFLSKPCLPAVLERELDRFVPEGRNGDYGVWQGQGT